MVAAIFQQHRYYGSDLLQEPANLPLVLTFLPIISRFGGASFGDSLVVELLDVCPESSLGGVVGPGSRMVNNIVRLQTTMGVV